MTLFLALAGTAFLIVLLARRHWVELNSDNLGNMSRQWLAEYNQQHP